MTFSYMYIFNLIYILFFRFESKQTEYHIAWMSGSFPIPSPASSSSIASGTADGMKKVPSVYAHSITTINPSLSAQVTVVNHYQQHPSTGRNGTIYPIYLSLCTQTADLKPRKVFGSADCDTVYTIHLSLDPSHLNVFHQYL